MLPNVLILIRLVARNARDTLPLIATVVIFQYLVIRQPLPDVAHTLLGAALVIVGLTLFLEGLTMSLFPLGAAMMKSILERGQLGLLLLFAFGIGFGSTVAEPALITVTSQAAEVAYAQADSARIEQNALIFRVVCATAVGLAVVVGCLRIVRGWSASAFVVGGYGLVFLLAVATQSPLTAIAFDAGSAATSAINVPLISAMGVGLATLLKGRNPLVDGFGVVALCSVMPMLGLLLCSLFLA